MMYDASHTFQGMRVVESLHMVEHYEDWSKVRSPSRARRRMKRGHKQNVKYFTKPQPGAIVLDGVMYVHPEVAKQLREEVERMKTTDFYTVIRGGGL